MLKTERDRLFAELASLDNLLASLPENDYLGRMSLESRRDELRGMTAALEGHEERRARIALYFGGAPVIGSLGVQAQFGTNAIDRFQELISKVWGDAEGGQLAAMGPIKDKAASQLHITGLVHGSFGFLLEEMDETEPLFDTPLNKAADRVTDYLSVFAGEDEHQFSEAIEELNPRIFQALREFLGVVYKGKATLRLVDGEREARFDKTAIERAWRRVEASEVEEDDVTFEGRLLGVIPVRRRFEFEPDDLPQILEGKVGNEFTESYLERVSQEQFAGRRWRALLKRRKVAKADGSKAETFTLLKLDEIQSPP